MLFEILYYVLYSMVEIIPYIKSRSSSLAEATNTSLQVLQTPGLGFETHGVINAQTDAINIRAL